MLCVFLLWHSVSENKETNISKMPRYFSMQYVILNDKIHCMQRVSLGLKFEMHLSFHLSNGVYCQVSFHAGYFVVFLICFIQFSSHCFIKFDFIVRTLSAKKNISTVDRHYTNNNRSSSNNESKL